MGSTAGWVARGGYASTRRDPTHVQSHQCSQAAQGPWPLGEPQLNLTFSPGHRTQSPHGLGCSKRNVKSDTDNPIRPLEARPSLTPNLDHTQTISRC